MKKRIRLRIRICFWSVRTLRKSRKQFRFFCEKKIYEKKFAEDFRNFFGAQAPNIYLKNFPGRLDLSTVLI